MSKTGHPVADPLLHASDVAALIARSKRIIIAAGAGISVSCGIPDFRSEKVGLYTSGRHLEDGIPSAELFFDFDYFELDPTPFYRVAKSLVEINAVPSKTHDFLRLLEKIGKLKRIYTQNIDGLERAAGCKAVVQCHGTMETFHCMKCRRKDTLQNCRRDFVERNSVPFCRFCKSGVMKPDIVFFGESCPVSVSRNLDKDVSSCDLIIVLGTSLKVKGPVTQLLDTAPSHVPRVLINNQMVSYIPVGKINSPENSKKRKLGISDCSSVSFAAALLGSCDDVIEYLCDANHWTDALADVRKERIEIECCLIPAGSSKHSEEFNRHDESADTVKGEGIENSTSLRRSSRARRPSRQCDVGGNTSEDERETIKVEDKNVAADSCGESMEETVNTGPIVVENDASNENVFRITRQKAINDAPP